VKLVGDVGNWKIVAHIAFKFYSVASGTFSTGSTCSVSGRSAAVRENHICFCPLHATV
jgi:hypothetical protein